MGQSSSSNSNELLNFVSIFFVALSVFVCLLALLIVGDALPAGPLEPATEVPAEDSLLVENQLPTATPSVTPEPTDPPANTLAPTETATWTPLPSNTPTDTPLPSSTAIPSITPTFTASPTATLTPSPTFTPTNTPTATDPPPTAGPAQILQYQLPNPIIYRDAFLNPGCEYQGIGGTVTQNGNPINGVFVRVIGPGINEFAASGSNTQVGGGGWVIGVADEPIVGVYSVQVYGADQTTTLSNPVVVQFTGECERNFAFLQFVQVQ